MDNGEYYCIYPSFVRHTEILVPTFYTKETDQFDPFWCLRLANSFQQLNINSLLGAGAGFVLAT